MTQAEKETAMRDCDGTELRPGDQVEFVNECTNEVRGLIATVTAEQDIPIANKIEFLMAGEDAEHLVEVGLDSERGVVRPSDIRKVQAEETAQ